MATIGLIDMDGESDVVEEDILSDDVCDIPAPTSAPCWRRAEPFTVPVQLLKYTPEPRLGWT